MLSVLCPFCDTVFGVSPGCVSHGKRDDVTCPHCGRTFAVRYVVAVEYADEMPLPTPQREGDR